MGAWSYLDAAGKSDAVRHGGSVGASAGTLAQLYGTSQAIVEEWAAEHGIELPTQKYAGPVEPAVQAKKSVRGEGRAIADKVARPDNVVVDFPLSGIVVTLSKEASAMLAEVAKEAKQDQAKIAAGIIEAVLEDDAAAHAA